MFLIHLRLRGPDGTSLPQNAADLIAESAIPEDGLEHISVHPDTEGGPTLGFFVTASGLVHAEASARRLAVRALDNSPALHGYSVLTCGAALVPGPWWGED